MTKKQKKVLIRIIISAIITVTTAVVKPDNEVLNCILFMTAYIVIGYDILKKAVKGIFNGQVFDENFLMAVATVGALALGEFMESVAVMLFYQIGELFQSLAVGKSRKNIANLMDIRPDSANLVTDEGIVETDPDDVPTGSLILVRVGEKIPIDGIVEEGESNIDTSALTGESLPKFVCVGDEVISGCINTDGVIKIRTTKEFGDSTVARILELVENAAARKSRSEKFISRFAKYYTPIVCAGALILAIPVPLMLKLFGVDAVWTDWIYRSLTFLVISCPCALVISIPLTFFAGIGCAGSKGILIKGSNFLEILSGVKIVVFDKTGTLTKGSFAVTDVKPENISREELLKYAAYAEHFSSHPISRSVVKAYEGSIDESFIKDAREISGHGVEAVIFGKNIAAGNYRLMEKIGVDMSGHTVEGTVVHVAVDGKYCGYIEISDEIKEHSKKALKDLKKLGIRKTVMLTGDTQATAVKVSKSLMIDETHYGLLPKDKVDMLENLLEKKTDKEVLAFVGDGINDAPVLSRADIGIAMGAMGSDAAIEAADVVLMDDDPAKIAEAIRLSAKCIRIVYENIFFAIGVKVICLILGAAGIANMWVAIFADVGVMVIAVLNAIRVLFEKK